MIHIFISLDGIDGVILGGLVCVVVIAALMVRDRKDQRDSERAKAAQMVRDRKIQLDFELAKAASRKGANVTLEQGLLSKIEHSSEKTEACGPRALPPDIKGTGRPKKSDSANRGKQT